jgi:hypothetical protein
MNNLFYIYIAFRPWDGSPCYVGKGMGRRWRTHLSKSHNKQLRGIVSKAGGEIPIVVIRSGLSEPESFVIEMAFIKAIGRYPHGPLVNHTDGGEGMTGYKQSADTIEKRVSKIRGIPRPTDVVAKIALSNTGKKRTDEVKEKLKVPKSLEHRRQLSLAKKGKSLSPEHIASLVAAAAPRKGCKRSHEIGAKVSAALMGKKATDAKKAILKAANRSGEPEVIERITEATRLAMQRPEVQEKMRLARERRYPKLTEEERLERDRANARKKSKSYRERQRAKLLAEQGKLKCA